MLGPLGAVLLFIFYIQPDASDLAPHRTKLDQLLERRDTIYDNLRDLRFEYRSGKYSEGDFEAMKTALEHEAALVLAEIDQVTDAQVRRGRGTADGERGRAMKWSYSARLALLRSSPRLLLVAQAGNRSRHSGERHHWQTGAGD